MGKEKPLPIPAPYTAPPDPPDPAEALIAQLEALNAHLIALEAKDPAARLTILETEQANVKSRLEALEKPKPVTL